MSHLNEHMTDTRTPGASRVPDHPNTVEETLARLGIGRTSFYDLANRGAIEVVKLGNRTFVRESELHRFMAELPTRHAKRAA